MKRINFVSAGVIGFAFGFFLACLTVRPDVSAATVAKVELSRYEYDVLEVVKVVDADTVDMRVDLGFKIHKEDRFRLYGIDAWEVRGEERPKGLLATEFLKAELAKGKEEGKVLIIQTYKDKQGKYGRYLATLLLVDDESKINLNKLLVEKGHAEYADY
jgi:micrococcal nuclease